MAYVAAFITITIEPDMYEWLVEIDGFRSWDVQIQTGTRSWNVFRDVNIYISGLITTINLVDIVGYGKFMSRFCDIKLAFRDAELAAGKMGFKVFGTSKINVEVRLNISSGLWRTIKSTPLNDQIKYNSSSKTSWKNGILTLGSGFRPNLNIAVIEFNYGTLPSLIHLVDGMNEFS